MKFIRTICFLGAIIYLGSVKDVAGQSTIEVKCLNQPFATGIVKPDGSFASGAMPSVGSQGNFAYLTFNLSALPAGAQITQAYVVIHSTGGSQFIGSSGNATGNGLDVNTTVRQPSMAVINAAPVWIDNMDWSNVLAGPVEGIFNAAGLAAIQGRSGSWIAFGIRPPGSTGNSRSLTGYNSTTTNAPPPSLFITYSTGGSQAPICNFGGSPTQVYTGDNVYFTDNSGNNPTSWLWEFGDGTTSTQKNPVKMYDSAGTFTVKLTVTNSSGNNSKTRTNYIQVTQRPPAPKAGFKAIPLAVFPGDTIRFTDTSQNNPTSWKWNFGDSTNSTEQNPLKVYTIAGYYDVTLMATSTWGSDTMIKPKYIRILGETARAPQAKFSYVQNFQRADFADESDFDPDSWNWDFDAASAPGTKMSQEQDPTWFYTEPGQYLVCLVAGNAVGKDTTCKELQVNMPPAPVADFTWELKPGYRVQFTDNSANSPSQWEWNFGEGNTSDKETPLHTFAGPGTYNVCLTVYNLNGSSAKCKNVVVQAVSSVKVHKAMSGSVYPNPARDYLIVKMDEEMERLEILDVLGQVVYSGSRAYEPGREHRLNLEDLEPGSYYVRVRGMGQNVGSFAFIIVN